MSYIVHDNVWEIHVWLFVREYPIAAMLNSSLKIVLYKSLAGLVELIILAIRNKKRSKN